MNKLVSILALLALLLIAGIANAEPYLVQWGFGGHNTPEYLGKNAAKIEAIRPFDGLIVNSKVMYDILQSKPVSYDRMAQEFKPINKNTFKKLKHNLLCVYWGGGKTWNKPPDLFDDWSVQIENVKRFARLAKEKGFAGLYIDNEEYSYTYWRYPDNVKYKNKSLKDYHMQARLRGKQVMEAARESFPEVAVITLHGPYKSCSESIKYIRDWASEETIIGAFAAGIIEGSGGKSIGVDGGELYDLNVKDQFDRAYQWQKYGIAAPDSGCLFMDEKLRKEWSKKCSVGYGVYDHQAPQYDKYPQFPEWQKWIPIKDPTFLFNRVKLALERCDNYVWFYTEGNDWVVLPEDFTTPKEYHPAPPSAEMVKAVADARKAVQRKK